MLDLVYSGLTHLARLAAAFSPARDGKVWRTLRARRGIRARYTAWGHTHRAPERPLLWMHAPSVGEGLQARPVLQRLRATHRDLQLAYTYFSPSAERFARALDVDFTEYLPFDTAGDAGVALDALQPRALVFSKLDVWPTLTREAARRGVRLGLISATLSAHSSRRGGVAAALLREAYARLDAVGAIDPSDAERLVALGVRPDVISITGDTRYDQVWARAAGVDRTAPLLAALASLRPTLVAGSTWPSDEGVLLKAWDAVRRQLPTARIIIAPHEPVAYHLSAIEQWASQSALRLARLDAPDAGAADVVLVDRVGILGDLYALAQVAYVGGGFHSAGLHSVLEPAAFGVPVVFGSRFQGSRDAGLLRERGGGISVANAQEMATQLTSWLTHHHDAGACARTVVQKGLGAAERSTTLVEQLLNS